MEKAGQLGQWLLPTGYTRPAVLAHRGRHDRWRENTLEAFADAVSCGADGVELDVRQTGDGALVVHHDALVPRLGPIAELTRAELPDWLPTLGQALDTCAGYVVDVEIKHSPLEPGYDPSEAIAAAVAGVVSDAMTVARRPRAVLVTSFFPATLRAVTTACPSLPTGLLVLPALDAVAALDEAARAGCRALLPFRSQVTPELVAAAHDRAMAVVAWTVDEDDDLRSAAAAGCDAVVTDRVERACAVLGGG